MMSVTAERDGYRITWLVRRLFRSMARRSDAELSRYDLTAADRAVMEFLLDEDALSVPEIAGRYDVSRQHVQVTVNRLLERGLLSIAPNPRHKRSVLISLTGRAKKLFRKIRAGDEQIVRDLFSSIPRREIKTTRATLEVLLHRLQQDTQEKTR